MMTASASVTSRFANNGRVVLEGIPEITTRTAERVERFLSARFATHADWSHHGDSIYLLTRFAEVAQLHRVDRPEGARHQLTFFREPVLEAARRPGSEELLLMMDEGGSEFWQLYLFHPATGERRRLTDGASRNEEPLWSRDGGRLAFTSTRRDGRSNDLWVMEVEDPAAARCVLEVEAGARWSAADWGEDGSRLLVSEYRSIHESRLHLLDLRSGDLRTLAGADAPASWLGVRPRFTPGDTGILVATDAVTEFEQLGSLDMESGRFTPFTASIEAGAELLALSPDRRSAAFVVNVDGYGQLYLLDPSTGAHERVTALPPAVIQSLRFSPGGDRIALTLAPPDAPSDVYTLAVGDDRLSTDSLVRWSYSELGGIRPGQISCPELIRYPSFDGRDIPAFVHRPPGPGPHPVIIQIHGGPESQTRPEFVPAQQLWVAELGTAVIRPNVRGSAGYGKSYLTLDDGRLREDSVRDIGALLDWVAEQPDLDPKRVAVYGGSYGGYMVLASLVHYGDRLVAGVELVGISDFVTFLENTQAYRRDLRRAEYGDERDPEMRAFLRSISPATHARTIRTPLLVAQGANDPRVPESESRQIVDAVRANDRPVWYMNALDEGHGFRRRENQDLFMQLVMEFLERHLGSRRPTCGNGGSTGRHATDPTDEPDA